MLKKNDIRIYPWTAAPSFSSVPRCCGSFLPIAPPSTVNIEHEGCWPEYERLDQWCWSWAALPAGLLREPCVWCLWAADCSHGWGRRWPGTNDHHCLMMSSPHICRFHPGRFYYLSSLRNLPGGCFLFVRLLFLSGFIDVPLPGDHGLDGLLDWPAVDLLVLEQQRQGSWGENSEEEAGGWWMMGPPSLRRSCMDGASGVFLHFHPAPRHMTSCSGSENTTQTCITLSINTVKKIFNWMLLIITFSKAHLSWVYSAYLLMKGSNLSGIIVL